MKTFRQWILSEGKDIFGFAKNQVDKEQNKEEYDGPIIPIKADFLIEYMMRNKINGIEPFSDYPDQIQWGVEPGAVRMVISPLGSFKSIIRKLQTNLIGESVWACKMIMPYRDIMHSNFAFDESFSDKIFEKITQVYAENINAPNSEYRGLESLSVKTYKKCLNGDFLPKLFIPMGIRMLKKDERYIIHFECRGHGVEAPGSGRIEAFMIEMSYNPATGMVRSFGHEVQSPTRGHTWHPQPSEWDELYSPSQPDDEIISSIANALSTY